MRRRDRNDGFEPLSPQDYMAACDREGRGRSGQWWALAAWCVAVLAAMSMPLWLTPLVTWMKGLGG